MLNNLDDKDSSICFAPETVSGFWYSDNWTSPYLSLIFKTVPKHFNSLNLMAFRPKISCDSDAKQDVLLRSGFTVLKEFQFSKASAELITLNIPLQECDSDGTFHVSLRVSRPLRPPLPDRRKLGLVLLEVTLI